MKPGRTPLVVANWKMNKTPSEAAAFCDDFLSRLPSLPETVDLAIAPAFPALDGSKVATGAKGPQIALVLNGKQGTAMASFSRLTDAELAAVITYTRTAWGNKAGEVQPSEVKAARKG